MFDELFKIRILLSSFNDNVKGVIQNLENRHLEDQKKIKELEEKIKELETK